MLKEMRTLSRSWIMRAFLIILGILMSITITQRRMDIMSIFAGFTGPRGVADVAGFDIVPRQLTRELDIALKYQRQQGQDLTQAEAVQQGLHTRLLESIISRRALQGYAEKLGIHADPTQVAEAIRQIPAVRGGLGGGFDRQSYESFLREIGYSQNEFEAEQRGDIETAMLMRALTSGIRAPESFGKLVLAFQSETRTLSLAEAPVALVGAPPAPDATQIQAFYEDNAQAFRVPEYRALTLVYARASDFLARVNVPDAQLLAEFETRRAGLTEPEKRTFVRLTAANEQQARDAVTRLSRGEAPGAVARALGVQMVRGENQTRDAIADPAVAEAVFAMPAGAAPRAVPARLTPFAVIKLEAITPAVTPTFESQREGLRQVMAQDQATDLLNASVAAFDDARAGGATVADAARQHGLAVVVVPSVDAQGLTPEGQPAEAFVDQAELIHLAFATPEGEASDFTPSGDADVVVSVDRITPPTTRPLDSVRPQLIAGWTSRERIRRLTDLGQQVVEDVAHGKSFAQAVRDHRLTMRVTAQPIDRRSASQLPSRNLAAEIFGAQPGAVVTGVRNDGGSLMVANVISIQRADPAQQRPFIEQSRMQMQQALGQSMIEAVTAEAVHAGHARRNEALIRQTFARISGEEEDQPAQ